MSLAVSPEGGVQVSPRDVSSVRDVNHTFTCSAMGGPGNTFTWTRLLDGVVVSQMSSLTVVVDGADKGGDYRCTVQNDAGNETDDVILRGITINKSKITIFSHCASIVMHLLTPVAVAVDTHPQTANVSIGDDFTLTCTASAFPLPNITWLHNGSLVVENGRITTTQTTTPRTVTSSITTDNATTTDSGLYVCRVGAPAGTDFNTTDSDPALILVQGEAGIFVCVFGKQGHLGMLLCLYHHFVVRSKTCDLEPVDSTPPNEYHLVT